MRFSRGMIFQFVQSTTTNLQSFFRDESTARSRSPAPLTSTQAKSPSFSLYPLNPSPSWRGFAPRISTAPIPAPFASFRAFVMPGMSETSRTTSFSGVGRAHGLHGFLHAAPVDHYPSERPYDSNRLAVLENVPAEGHTHGPGLHHVVVELEDRGI